MRRIHKGNIVLATAGMLALLLLGGFFGRSALATIGQYDATDGIQDTSGAGHPVSCQDDIADRSTDDALGQGSKDDRENPTFVTNSIPPNKSNLTRACFGLVVDPGPGPNTGDVIAYGYWERSNILGTANFSFEINQQACPTVSPTSPPCDPNLKTPQRLANDLLIIYDFAQNGNSLTVGVSKWVASGPSSQCEKNASTPCWGHVQNITPPNGEASINTDLLRGEMAIDLTRSGIIPAGTCTSFNSIFVKGRSSAAFDSELKDVIAPFGLPFNNCGEVRITKQDDAGNLLDGVTFTLYSDNAPTGSAIGAEDTVIGSCVTGASNYGDSTVPSTGTCEFLSVQAGAYWLDETVSAPHAKDATFPKNFTLTALETKTFTATNPRLHRVITIVCHEGTDTLDDNSVTFDGSTKTSLSALPAGLAAKGVTEADLCTLGGAQFDDKSHGTFNGSTTIAQ